MPTVLRPDDLRPRQIVAVHSYINTPNFGPALIPEGNPFRILSLSLPFITVSSLLRTGGWSPPIIFDIRHASLTRVSQSYVRSLRAARTESPTPPATLLSDYGRRLLGGVSTQPPPPGKC